ncbi:hypothetical protein GTZ99_08350 [Novosphingobium sp. FSY-8]|uniref:Uncharacterized protein n=1 Tax=Novosphingobium ovatum TaxID=1908523 RepID=A0ABW9XDF1_9SPHN|nr:hypothetical protein [Novosphingobium ovatum]NBC36566.1 hypothetical protein [Novosphingobium ovatum]
MIEPDFDIIGALWQGLAEWASARWGAGGCAVAAIAPVALIAAGLYLWLG